MPGICICKLCVVHARVHVTSICGFAVHIYSAKHLAGLEVFGMCSDLRHKPRVRVEGEQGCRGACKQGAAMAGAAASLAALCCGVEGCVVGVCDCA